MPKALLAALIGSPHSEAPEIYAWLREHRFDLEDAFRGMIEAGSTTLWPDPLADDVTPRAVMTEAELRAVLEARDGAARKRSQTE